MAPLISIRQLSKTYHRGKQPVPVLLGIDLEIEAGRRLDGTADRIEGRRAFLERRPPVFRGR